MLVPVGQKVHASIACTLLAHASQRKPSTPTSHARPAIFARRVLCIFALCLSRSHHHRTPWPGLAKRMQFRNDF
eukprot:516544-Pleurochrysis_carterae.AAC.1